MSTTIADILANKSFEEPDEVQIIKEFVRETFQSTVGVTIQTKAIIIYTPSAALAGSLRMHLRDLTALCDTDKRLVIRIGQNRP